MLPPDAKWSTTRLVASAAMAVATKAARSETAVTERTIVLATVIQPSSGRRAVTAIKIVATVDTTFTTACAVAAMTVAAPGTATTTSVPRDVVMATEIIVTTIMASATTATTSNTATAWDRRTAISKMRSWTLAPAAALQAVDVHPSALWATTTLSPAIVLMVMKATAAAARHMMKRTLVLTSASHLLKRSRKISLLARNNADKNSNAAAMPRRIASAVAQAVAQRSTRWYPHMLTTYNTKIWLIVACLQRTISNHAVLSIARKHPSLKVLLLRVRIINLNQIWEFIVMMICSENYCVITIKSLNIMSHLTSIKSKTFNRWHAVVRYW